ncbi:BCL3 [Mytilus coruscus]|uniref:BCL3 n=1 Tax=Mytilus coruscus TaxID=42192 RepID=A0A6J8EPN7_MYTCO|nr:BCL3 [Mytilus coruscus]
MATRRKSKKLNEATKIDEKEHADRIAAAEAMSCLSSMVLLPSNSDELFSLSIGSNVTVSKSAPVDTKNNAKSATSNANKKGKTRTRATKNSQTPTSKKAQTEKDKNAASTIKQKQKSPKYASTLVVSSSKQNKLPDQVLSLTINPRNPNHELKKVETPKTHNKDPKNAEEQVEQQPGLTPPYIQIEPLVAQPCIIQVDHNKPGHGLYNLSMKSDGVDGQNKVAKEIASKLVNLASTESVELSQSAVDTILTQMALKQKIAVTPKESSESSLPLKKRRLQGYKEEGVQPPGDDISVEQDPAKSEASAVQNAYESKERVNPVAVDPSTSLMLLNEMQVALQQDDDGDLPLHIAVVHENIVMVQKFVHLMSISGKSVDKFNKAQQTPLHIAVELKFIQAVHTLLLAGANPNLVNKNGETCIHIAVKSNSVDCLHLIFKYTMKPDLNARNFDGLAPIHMAVMRNNMEIVRFLLAERADVNIQDGKSGRTPLFYSVEGNLIPMVELFQKVGANLDLPNYASVTAVMAAQARGFHEIASMLLRCMDSKAYLEMKEREKGTPVKKVPIPRIPSKSHLIQGVDSKPTLVDFQQLANSDSNDSSQSFSVMRKRARSTDGKKEKDSIKQDTESKGEKMEIEESTKTEEDMKPVENGIQESKLEVAVPQQQNQVLIPRELLEKLQSTMLSLLTMQKLQQASGIAPSSPTSLPSVGHLPVQNALLQHESLQNTLLRNAVQNANSQGPMVQNAASPSVSKQNSVPQHALVQNSSPQSVSIPNSTQPSVSVQNNITQSVPFQNVTGMNLSNILLNAISASLLDTQNKSLEPSPAKNNMIENDKSKTSMDTNNSMIENDMPKKGPLDLKVVKNGSTNESKKDTNSNKGNEKSKEKTKTKHAVLQQLLNVKNNDAGKVIEKKQKVVDNTRVEEPMEVSESRSSTPDNSFNSTTKTGKAVGHAAMNQLGRVTNVSSSLQATLLQMLQAKQNKPLNLSTGKDSSNTS